MTDSPKATLLPALPARLQYAGLELPVPAHPMSHSSCKNRETELVANANVLELQPLLGAWRVRFRAHDRYLTLSRIDRLKIQQRSIKFLTQ